MLRYFSRCFLRNLQFHSKNIWEFSHRDTELNGIRANFLDTWKVVISTGRRCFVFVLCWQKLEKQAAERDPVLRADWFMRLANWNANQLVFLDESGINKKSGVPKYGYAKKGSRVHYKVTSQKAENFSLLPAMSVNGYIAINVFKGGVNAEMYEDFIRDEVLPRCTPWPGPCSVIIMDNAEIHRNEVWSIFNNID